MMRRYLNDRYVRMREKHRSERLQGFPSYSQFGEDAVINRLLDGERRKYLDIGAGHPVRYSNTYSFYRRGWSGILVEPLAQNVQHASDVRPRDSIVQAICGRDDGAMVEIFEYEPYEYSTISQERVQELAQQGREPIGHHHVRVMSIAELLRSNGDMEVDLLSLDVEGSEWEVLQSADWSHFRPRVAVIEEWISPIAEPSRIFEFMTAHGYELAATAGFSSIYRAL
ncbi:FkbM family methyltransferase [Candidatus Nanopelagicales bacterium]|nr:FkbM family methyltransferase [Candidatus Nanopelagicales bacterium]